MTKSKICANCKFARKACNDDFVGCIKYNIDQSQTCYDNMSLESYMCLNMQKLQLEKVAGTGWVYTGTTLDGIDHQNMGIMTNGILVVEPDNSCEQFRAR